MTNSNQALIDSIRKAVIGEGRLLDTPFGKRPLVYADYTASGRSLSFIEDFIRDQILPFYANTHTEISATGRQTTAYREQARQLIKNSINAGDEYGLIFAGSGATGAIHKLIEILNLCLPDDVDRRYLLADQIPEAQRPVVFIGPYEHHSNELPWRESIADLVSIPMDSQGQIDQKQLERELQFYQDRAVKIGSFSAASNVTGLLSDVDSISCLLHQYGASVFWDYAAAAPYVEIDMKGKRSDIGNCSKDAIFISPHKFVGGPGTSGILVARKSLLQNRVPSIPGGGTVSFVTPEKHTYISDHERREEGGTPAIIESIRAGLVFQLKDAVGAVEIEQREREFIRRALDRWCSNPDIQVLGNLQVPRIAIVSLQICRNTKPLHYGFIVALLNDLFGIQARGGCSCAGPYAHRLLELNCTQSLALEEAINAGHNILSPGWVRLNFNYFFDENTFDYLIQAVELIAQYGWALLPFYSYDPSKGLWYFRDKQHFVELRSLQELFFTQQQGPLSPIPQAASQDVSLSFYLQQAIEIMKEKIDSLQEATLGEQQMYLPPDVECLRWFYLPQDI